MKILLFFSFLIHFIYTKFKYLCAAYSVMRWSGVVTTKHTHTISHDMLTLNVGSLSVRKSTYIEDEVKEIILFFYELKTPTLSAATVNKRKQFSFSSCVLSCCYNTFSRGNCVYSDKFKLLQQLLLLFLSFSRILRCSGVCGGGLYSAMINR